MQQRYPYSHKIHDRNSGTYMPTFTWLLISLNKNKHTLHDIPLMDKILHQLLWYMHIMYIYRYITISCVPKYPLNCEFSPFELVSPWIPIASYHLFVSFPASSVDIVSSGNSPTSNACGGRNHWGVPPLHWGVPSIVGIYTLKVYHSI